MQKLIEFNENQDTPLYHPSHLEDLEHKSEYFEVPDLETRIPRHDNPHYLLQQDILQVKNFQYRFVNNIILTNDTIPQVKIFTQLILKFFRFNYQLLWEKQDQQAYINFSQILTQTELLPYIIRNEHKHLQYRDLTSFDTAYFEQINLDHTFLVEHSETSDNRPFITSDISPETTPEEQTSNLELPYNRQHSVQSEQEDLTTLFQIQNLTKYSNYIHRIPQVSDIRQTNTSETATIQNTSEFSGKTIQNTQSFTITNDTNLIQVATHNITQDEFNNQNQDNPLSTTQDKTSVLSTANTNITQPSQTQASPRQNHDPPPIPPQFSTQIHTHNSPQQGSSNTQHNTQNTNTVHFQTPTPPSPSEIQTSTYTPTQTNPVQNVQTSLNINTRHSNPPFNYTTSRHLSRPSLQTILTNPLSYNLTSTNPSHTQQSQTKNNRPNSFNTFPSQHTSNTITPTLQTSQFQIQNPPSTTIRTNSHFHNTSSTSLSTFQITLHTILHHRLPYLTILFHTQHISTLLLQYQNPLNLLMD